MGHKRKRAAEDADVQDLAQHHGNDDSSRGATASKSRTEKPQKEKKGGERRQIRSERKAKRKLETQQNFAKKKELQAMLAEAGGDGGDGEDVVAQEPETGTKEGQDRSLAAEQEQVPPPKKQRKDTDPKAAEGDEAKPTSNTKPRFICFVGNLPYTATTPQIEAHFKKLQPAGVRHSTDKTTQRSKGFAFLEFDSFDKMKTCLKLYHHSMFDPERTAAGIDPSDDASKDGVKKGKGRNAAADSSSKGRRINVELTAGGGGKGGDRKKKIKEKNDKLDQERKRRHEAEKKEQGGKERKRQQAGTGANAVGPSAEQEVQDSRGAIHPSRLARVGH